MLIADRRQLDLAFAALIRCGVFVNRREVVVGLRTAVKSTRQAAPCFRSQPPCSSCIRGFRSWWFPAGGRFSFSRSGSSSWFLLLGCFPLRSVGILPYIPEDIHGLLRIICDKRTNPLSGRSPAWDFDKHPQFCSFCGGLSKPHTAPVTISFPPPMNCQRGAVKPLRGHRAHSVSASQRSSTRWMVSWLPLSMCPLAQMQIAMGSLMSGRIIS